MVEEQSNKHRTPQPALNSGDSAYLSSQYLSTDRPCRKLREKFLGPFKILERIGTKAYKLDLPLSMKVHPVFPDELLKPAPQDPQRRNHSSASLLPSSSKAKKSTRSQKS